MDLIIKAPFWAISAALILMMAAGGTLAVIYGDPRMPSPFLALAGAFLTLGLLDRPVIWLLEQRAMDRRKRLDPRAPRQRRPDGP